MAAVGEAEPCDDVPVEVLLRAVAAGADMGSAGLAAAEASGVLSRTGDHVRFESALLRRSVYAGEPPARRRAAHTALAAVLGRAAHRLLRLHHRACATEGTAPALADALAAAAAQPHHNRLRRSAALARSAELTADGNRQTARFTAAADQARLAEDTRAARTLVARARQLPSEDGTRGHAELVYGTLALRDGPVADAREILCTAARLLAPRHPAAAAEAHLGAAEAAWSTGAPATNLDAVTPAPDTDPLGNYRTGMRAFLDGRWGQGRTALRRCIDLADSATDPALLLRAGAAALVVGDVEAANTANTRALAAAQTRGTALLVPQALEHLAYSELRAGRHAKASAHAHQGLLAAHQAGQRNTGEMVHHQRGDRFLHRHASRSERDDLRNGVTRTPNGNSRNPLTAPPAKANPSNERHQRGEPCRPAARNPDTRHSFDGNNPPPTEITCKTLLHGEWHTRRTPTP
ncbi:hypothetical protein [Streptomyces sp. Ac-502]|uniref:hypothetical protein n=1 Tax=Streptomyces sp. Ac-502 TaxID=3342801 RepID=UPI0038622767